MKDPNRTSPIETPRDPWGDRDELRRALDRPELDDFDTAGGPSQPLPEPARRAAYDLATALGRCRLHGVDLACDDGVLPLEVARAAMEQWVAALDDLVRIASELSARFDRAADSLEIEDLCLNLLGDRLDAWAAFLAIDEAYETAQEETDAGFSTPLLPLFEAIERYDEALLGQLDILAIVADIPMLENWRAQLAPQFRDFLPWFLDGRIEQTAAALDQVALALAPDPAPAGRVAPRTASQVPAGELDD
jgi:hypothetical protein